MHRLQVEVGVLVSLNSVSFFSQTPFRVFSPKPASLHQAPATGALTSANQRGSDNQQYPQSQHISAAAAICPVYCIQLPPAFNLTQT